MTDYWTDDAIPATPSALHVTWRGGLLATALLGTGFGLGWLGTGSPTERHSGSQMMPLGQPQVELRAIAAAIPDGLFNEPSESDAGPKHGGAGSKEARTVPE